MPNKDQTGPRGKGPRTGRGMGDCGTTEKQLDQSRSVGRGQGGAGKGMGRGNCGGRRKGANGITYFT